MPQRLCCFHKAFLEQCFAQLATSPASCKLELAEGESLHLLLKCNAGHAKCRRGMRDVALALMQSQKLYCASNAARVSRSEVGTVSFGCEVPAVCGSSGHRSPSLGQAGWLTDTATGVPASRNFAERCLTAMPCLLLRAPRRVPSRSTAPSISLCGSRTHGVALASTR
jgi:hypothetical protein